MPSMILCGLANVFIESLTHFSVPAISQDILKWHGKILKIFHDILAARKTQYVHAERSCIKIRMWLHKIYGESLPINTKRSNKKHSKRSNMDVSTTNQNNIPSNEYNTYYLINDDLIQILIKKMMHIQQLRKTLTLFMYVIWNNVVC